MAMHASDRKEPYCPHCNQQINTTVTAHDNSSAPQSALATTRMIIGPDKIAAGTDGMSQQLSVRIEMAKHTVQSVMDRWLQDKTYWRKGPQYIQMADYLMNSSEADTILDALGAFIRQHFVIVLDSTPNRKEPLPFQVYQHHHDDLEGVHCLRAQPPDQDTIVYRHKDLSLGIQTDVALQRTAIIKNSLGAIKTDGITISISRYRFSKRVLRPAILIEKRRDNHHFRLS